MVQDWPCSFQLQMSPQQESEAQAWEKCIEQRLGKSTREINGLVDKLEDAGFKPRIFNAKIPVAQHLGRIDKEDEQVAQLLAQKGAFSALVLWNICRP